MPRLMQNCISITIATVRRIWSICAFDQTRCAFDQRLCAFDQKCKPNPNSNYKTNPNPNPTPTPIASALHD